MSEVPADWVLLEAAKRFGWEDFHISILRTGTNHGFRALCDMIAKYEQRPVDPDVEAMKRILSAWFGDDDGFWAEPNFARAVAQYKLERAK